MFKLTLCLFAALVVCAKCSPGEEQATVLRNDFNVHPDSYDYAYDTTNGIRAQATGNDQGSQGEFAWTSPEGVAVKIQYVANENGYQPQGDAIPVAPPVPEAILKALKYIAEHPPQE